MECRKHLFHTLVADGHPQAAAGLWIGQQLVLPFGNELLALNYDPSYLRSLRGRYSKMAYALRVTLTDISPSAMQKAAGELLQAVNA